MARPLPTGAEIVALTGYEAVVETKHVNRLNPTVERNGPHRMHGQDHVQAVQVFG